MSDIEKVIDIVKSYYIDNNKIIPKSVKEYIADYPSGYSRQVLKSRFNLSTAEIVKLINPEYVKPMSAKERAVHEATRLGYEILSDISSLTSNRQTVLLGCITCGYNHTTSIASLHGSVLGCPKCKSRNLPWKSRKTELEIIIADRLNGTLVSEIPDNQTGYIDIKHNICGQTYTAQLVGVVSPNSPLRATCPTCRPTDRRITVNGITFGSRFEYDCYLILQKHNPELHVRYDKYLTTNRHWVCDFKIRKYWIEVSNFKIDYKNYFSNIEDKQNLVESAGQTFYFVTSTKELEELSSLL